MASTSELLKILRPLVLENYDKEEWNFIKDESKGPGGKDRLESIGKDLFGITDYSRKKYGGKIIKRQSGGKVKNFSNSKNVIKKKIGGQIGKPRGWGAARYGIN